MGGNLLTFAAVIEYHGPSDKVAPEFQGGTNYA